MSRLQVFVGLLLVVLGLIVGWIGLNLSAVFADLGSVAISRGDDGSAAALVLVPTGLLVVASGITVAVLARGANSRR